MFYLFPRLLRTEIYSEKLGVVTVAAWNIVLVALVVTLAMGITQGREYAEMVWPIDIGIVLAFVLIFIKKKDYIVPSLFMLLIGFSNYILGKRGLETRFMWPIFLCALFGLSFYYLILILKQKSPYIAAVLFIVISIIRVL